MFSAKFERRYPNKAKDVVRTVSLTLSEHDRGRCQNKVKDVQSNPTRPRSLFEQDLEQDQGCSLSEQDPGRFSKKVNDVQS